MGGLQQTVNAANALCSPFGRPRHVSNREQKTIRLLVITLLIRRTINAVTGITVAVTGITVNNY